MSLAIRPILSALMRNRAGALLVAMQTAVTLAVLVNAVYIVHQRVERMGRPTGVDEQNLFQVSGTGFTQRFNSATALRDDLAYLRVLPGVLDAAPGATVPLGNANTSEPMSADPDFKGPGHYISMYMTDEHGLNTLGAHLIAGRNFRPDEILPPINGFLQIKDYPHQIIVSQSAARALFPGGNALGKVVYDQQHHAATIIGIMNDVMTPSWFARFFPYDVMLVPMPMTLGTGLLIRTRPGERDHVMQVVERHLSSSNPDRVILWVTSIEHFKELFYRDDRNLAIFLVAVTLLVTLITCISIFGLATFNVNTRTKQIGTRRAVGARRTDIVRYFMIENGLITSGGIVAGCLLALLVGYWLSSRLQLPRLSLYYLLTGVLVLWGIGQLAAWQPARRASAVPPSVATRTV
jgi:putative ABC transport system permease protein